MYKKIIYVGGNKGGVGKSKLSFAVIDYFVSNQKKVLLIESDTSNPDVYKAHHQHESLGIVCKQIDLDEANGWIELVNVSDEFADHYVVINSAARSNAGIEKYGATLRDTLHELKRDLITLWIINRQRDSIELLRGFRKSFPDAVIHVFRNLYFGAPEKFGLYHNSNTKNSIEKNGSTLDFPELADRVADKLYSDRLPIQIAINSLSIGDRAELRRWSHETKKVLQEILAKKT